MTTFLIFLTAIIGAMSTRWLAQRQKFFNAIRASSLQTILFYCLMVAVGQDADFWASVFFGGSFIGMSAPHKFSYGILFSSSLCFSLLFIILLPMLEGIGGALGCSAFISVVISHGINRAMRKLKGTSNL